MSIFRIPGTKTWRRHLTQRRKAAKKTEGKAGRGSAQLLALVFFSLLCGSAALREALLLLVEVRG
jgi:hypothetical protein